VTLKISQGQPNLTETSEKLYDKFVDTDINFKSFTSLIFFWWAGLALLDPHGDLVEKIAHQIPDHRKKDLIYFNVPDKNCPLGYNPLKRVIADKRPLAASGLLEAFKKRWEDSWGPRLEHILRNSLLALEL